jgi:hypothetical protein
MYLLQRNPSYMSFSNRKMSFDLFVLCFVPNHFPASYAVFCLVMVTALERQGLQKYLQGPRDRHSSESNDTKSEIGKLK